MHPSEHEYDIGIPERDALSLENPVQLSQQLSRRTEFLPRRGLWDKPSAIRLSGMKASVEIWF